jgi:hypothetical protein
MLRVRKRAQRKKARQVGLVAADWSECWEGGKETALLCFGQPLVS